MLLTDVSIKNRTTVAVLGLIIVLLGSYSYISLPREAFPDIPIPYIMITTIYEGVSPEDVETSVTMKIEKELSGIRDVKEVLSSSAEGMSLISVEFTPNVRTEVALQRVRDRVDLARGELPQEVEEPVIKEINIAEFPIMQISISGDVSPFQLKEIADDMEDALEMVPGVLKVDVQGALEREIRLEMDPDRVAQYNLTIPEILALIPSENVNISAGGVETPGTKFNVRIPAEFATPEEVDHLLLAVRDGRPIYLSDVATVRDTYKDRESFSRLNGKDNVTLLVRKRIGANVVRVSDMVRAVVEQARKQIPGGVTFDVIYDMSKYIRNTVSDLENNVLAALILVVAILMLFMGWRPSTIVAMIIPLSMLITFFLIQALGYTLNMIVLFSLILLLGMLVDNAIVIVENIYRHMQLGYSRVQAALLGAREVAWPVITSTFTTVCAFLPMMFWPGIMGDFMKYLPITLTLGLLASLFVALVFSPVITSIWAGRAVKEQNHRHWFMQGYKRFQRLGLENPGMALFLSVCLLIAMAMLYGKIGKGIEFFPEGDPERAFISVRAPQGTNIHETNRLIRTIEERIKPFEPWFDDVITNVGSASGSMDLMASAGGPHLANITMVFYDFMVRERPSTEIIAEVRKAIADIPGAEIKVEREEDGPPTGAPVTVRIVGEDFKTLERLSEQAKRMIADVPNLVNLRSDLEATRPELAFTVDRRVATLLGVNTATVGNFLKMAIFGTKVGTYRQFNDEYDITVRLPLKDRVNIDDLYRLQIPNAAGQSIPLSSLGKFEYKGGFGTINRVDQKRVVTVTADTEGRLSSAVLADVQRRLHPLGDPRLSPADILDWDALRRVLSDAQNQSGSGVVARVWQACPKKDARSLADALAAPTADEQQNQLILQSLNRVIATPGFFQAEDFQNAELPSPGPELLKRGRENLNNEEIQFLNRQALVAALPKVIAPGGRLDLPIGYEIRYAGEKEEQDEAQAFLAKAFLIALLLIVLVLVIQFNSLLVPIIIMTTVILSLIGALIGLLVVGLPFGIIMTGIGVISLAGVVVNNAIVLLDYTRQLQARGMDLVEAAAEAGATRLRPVMLTAATTVIGLIPMATGVSYDFHTFSWALKSESTQWWQNMAVVVIFGLSFATVLTLVVVPALYVMLTKASLRLHAWLGWHHEEESKIPAPASTAS
ncbi:MAG TPA: efflux RND transporter permease subunit [Sedimentisphaerales bacterium]|jgi:multidrug efflux pump subunit AcrB|nr:efflux RND transporter permease subunit [Sedimentisphaerales bacterium]HNU28101.1 efflux RND transporter permease subunit [Sedimentisphaerales bacterium]